MVILKPTADPESVNIERNGKHIGYLHWHKEKEPRIAMINAFGDLTISETETVLAYYRKIEAEKLFGKLLAKSIDDLDISVRLHLALKGKGIKTVWDIINTTPQNLGLQPKSLSELELVMKEQCELTFKDGVWLRMLNQHL